MVEYCDRCKRGFPHARALLQHEENSSSHNICNNCGVDFPTWIGLKEHYVQSRRHAYCQHCNEHFQDQQDLEEHYRDEHWFCDICKKVFLNSNGLHEHNRQCHASVYCIPCMRIFIAPSNLRSHQNSSIHAPKDVHCPFPVCTQTFVSRSAMLLHLESGSCPSRVTRQAINRIVRQLDTSNVITNPARLITGGRNTHDEITYSATAASWNGRAYECCLCHSSFPRLLALNQHLASPRHQEKIYVCPLSSCRLQFSGLSALCQHIESERCGISRFSQVQNTMDGLVSGVGRLTM